MFAGLVSVWAFAFAENSAASHNAKSGLPPLFDDNNDPRLDDSAPFAASRLNKASSSCFHLPKLNLTVSSPRSSFELSSSTSRGSTSLCCLDPGHRHAERDHRPVRVRWAVKSTWFFPSGPHRQRTGAQLVAVLAAEAVRAAVGVGPSCVVGRTTAFLRNEFQISGSCLA